MSTNDTSGQKPTARTDPRPPSILLGIDADATAHQYSTTRELVIAVEPDGTLANVVDVEREQRVHDDVLGAYMAFVADRHGWHRTWYDTSFGDLLARGLGERR